MLLTKEFTIIPIKKVRFTSNADSEAKDQAQNELMSLSYMVNLTQRRKLKYYHWNVGIVEHTYLQIDGILLWRFNGKGPTKNKYSVYPVATNTIKKAEISDSAFVLHKRQPENKENLKIKNHLG